MDMLSNGFGHRVGTGSREMVCQQSGIVGEGIEVDDREVAFRKRPSFVEEDGRGVPRVLDGFNRLVSTEK